MGLVKALLLLALVGCGRADFAPLADAADATEQPIDAVETRPVMTTITVDNAYSFAWRAGNVRGYQFGANSPTTESIFDCPIGVGPEQLTLDIPVGAQVYLVVWANLDSISGALGVFEGPAGHNLTGADWQVCATGQMKVETGPGPSSEEIQKAIDDCDAGGTVTSAGWVDVNGAVTPGAIGTLLVGEQNDSDSGVWPVVCPGAMPVDPRWMTYDPDGSANFDNTGNRLATYQLFRAPPL